MSRSQPAPSEDRGSKPAQGIADEETAGEIGGRQVALHGAAGGDQLGAQHARQQAAVERRRHQLPVAAHE